MQEPTMQIQIQVAEGRSSDAILEKAEQEITDALEVFREQITRVEVHLHDDDGPKSGSARRCVIEVRLAGHKPLAVEDTASEILEAIRSAAGKAERAVRRKVEKHKGR